MELNRPATKSQPSRKGKRAWRKNIDLDDIHEGLEEARELERTVGVKNPDEIEACDLFQIDTKGDESIKTRKSVKPLKSDEILNRRSAVPALNAPHRKSDNVEKKKKMIQGVVSNEIHRLMRVAGRAGDSGGLASIEKDGLTISDPYDLWGAGEEVKESVMKKNKATEKEDKQYKEHNGPENGSFLDEVQLAVSHAAKSVRPSTLDHKPISLVGEGRAKAVNLPEEGKSYNPSLDAWKELIEKELGKEQEREELRLKLEEERSRIEHIMETVESDMSIDNLDGNESDDENLEDCSVKSVNKPVVVKTKTRQQRNKEKRHEERLKLEAELRELKQQIKDLENIPRLLKEEQKKLSEAQEKEKARPGSKDRKKKLGKYHVEDAPLEVKLSEELTENLRRLKPEGNLTKERFRSLQERGLIEVRTKVSRKRKYAPKITEKWGYKDIQI